MPRTRLWISLGISIGTAVAAAPASAGDAFDGHVFVPNRDSADVAVIDPVRDEVVARIDVGEVPHQVAISDALKRLVTTNTGDDTISIVELTTGEALSLSLGHEPEHMELAPDGDLLAVGNIGAGSVSLVSLGEEREIARIEGLHQPHNMTFGPGGERLFVANLGAPLVSVIDVASGRMIDEIAVGEPGLAAGVAPDDGSFQGVISVTPTPDRRLGFAAYGEGDRVAVLDLGSGRTVRTLELGDEPWRAYGTADGRLMIVPNNGDRTVSIIDVARLEEIARLPGADDMTGVNTGWFETTAFVLSRGESKALIYDLEALAPAGEIALPGAPETGVVTPDGSKLYVALGSTGQVAVIDVGARKLVKVIDGVGEAPWGAHMVGALNYCH